MARLSPWTLEFGFCRNLYKSIAFHQSAVSKIPAFVNQPVFCGCYSLGQVPSGLKGSQWMFTGQMLFLTLNWWY